MLTTLGSALSGLIAFATVLMGARYLVSPQPAAAGFGIPGEFDQDGAGPGRPADVARGRRRWWPGSRTGSQGKGNLVFAG